MDVRTIRIDGHDAPVCVWSAEKNTGLTPIHFAHANGFPAGSYDAMLSQLAHNRDVYALNHRATWQDSPYQPTAHFDWKDAADDLIAAIEQVAPQGVIGVGHSLGAVMTLLAAIKRPDLFKQILLIEPVIFPTRFFMAFGWMPRSMQLRFAKVAQKTLARRENWDSPDELVESLSGKALFKGISTDVMKDYAKHGLQAVDDAQGRHYTLTFKKTWEAQVFLTAPYLWRKLNRLKTPCVVWRAEHGDVVPMVSWQKWQKAHPQHPIHVLSNLGHMAPLQNPQFMAQQIQEQMLSI